MFSRMKIWHPKSSVSMERDAGVFLPDNSCGNKMASWYMIFCSAI
jgi:hypothetical protein